MAASMSEDERHLATIAAHAAFGADGITGSVVPPLLTATTFARDEDYELRGPSSYARGGNPTLALAENAGFAPLEEVAAAKSRQVKDGNSCIGLGMADLHQQAASQLSSPPSNADGYHSMDMREVGVFETLIGKQQQIQLAAQVVKMILKIDDVISMGQYQ